MEFGVHILRSVFFITLNPSFLLTFSYCRYKCNVDTAICTDISLYRAINSIADKASQKSRKLSSYVLLNMQHTKLCFK